MNKYKPHIQYIKENIQTKSIREMAIHIGVSEYALKTQINRLRKTHNIPFSTYKKRAEIGEVRVIHDRGMPVEMIKTVEGWKRKHLYEGKPKKVNRTMVKKPPVTKKPAKVRTDGRRLPKKQLKQYNKRVDTTPKMAVYIPELRLTVYANPDASPDDVRKKYLEQREFNLKKVS